MEVLGLRGGKQGIKLGRELQIFNNFRRNLGGNVFEKNIYNLKGVF